MCITMTPSSILNLNDFFFVSHPQVFFAGNWENSWWVRMNCEKLEIAWKSSENFEIETGTKKSTKHGFIGEKPKWKAYYEKLNAIKFHVRFNFTIDKLDQESVCGVWNSVSLSHEYSFVLCLFLYISLCVLVYFFI